MSKKYFFLAGLPRSGNTLLSSILNQNTDIMVSAQSNISFILFYLNNLHYDSNTKNFPDHQSIDNLIESVFDSYYKNWNAKYIIDRGPWGTPSNLELLQSYYKNDIKIIVTVRDIVEMLSSFIRLDISHILNNQIKSEIDNGIRFNETYKSDIELSCEILMSPTGQIEKYLFSLLNLIKEKNKKYLHLVEYNDLVLDTENSIKKIYNFLEIPFYKDHNFNKIEDFKVNNIKYDDIDYVPNLHTLKNKISFPNYKIEDVLPKNVIKKYSDLEFWR